MDTKTRLVPIPGSLREKITNARLLKPSDPDQTIRISIYARSNPNPPADLVQRAKKLPYQLPKDRKYFTDEEYNKVYGADLADLQHIVKWAKEKSLRLIMQDQAQKKVELEGRIADINTAFGIELNDYDHPTFGHFRGRSGKVSVPENLLGVIDGVFGLDTRPIGHPRLRRSTLAPVKWVAIAPPERLVNGSAKAIAAKTATNPFPGSFFPPEVASLYHYPPATDGSGENIAVFAFNGPPSPDPRGGYDLTALNNYFTKVLGQKAPQIQDVVISGPGNDPGPDTEVSDNNGDSTGEVMLDMCVVGSVAPGAKIFMYFTEFSGKGWVNALTDAIAGKNNISVISVSYGNPEKDPQTAWTSMGIRVVNKAFQGAVSKGITICVSSGDDGSDDGGGKTIEVDFPASSPYVLGVGGTKLVAAAGSITSETVWNEEMQDLGAGGGGVSVVFTKPVWQNGVTVPVSAAPPHVVGRGVPDVSAVGDPETGVVVMHIDGKKIESIGGTSASAPLWGSLITRINQSMGARCGYLNPLLYTKFSAGVLRDITVGNNGGYSAAKGWDACTGLGSPDGNKLLSALSGKSKTKSGSAKKKKPSKNKK
jgi:kumamolisin